MLPLLLALLFAVVEYAYYLGGVHYVNYAAFAGARALQGNDDVGEVAAALLHGNVTRDATLASTGQGVTADFPWETQLPMFKQVIPDLSVQMTVVLGPPECTYELQDAEAAAWSDNRLPCN